MISRDLVDSDYYLIIPRPEAIEDMGSDWLQKYKKEYEACEFKKTVTDSLGNIVFLFGVRRDGWTWIISSELIEKYAIESMDTIRTLCEGVLEFYPDIQRVYTFNNPKWERALKWLKRWGFKEHSSHTFTDGKERILLIKERHGISG